MEGKNGLPPIPWRVATQPDGLIRLTAEAGWGGAASPDYPLSASLEHVQRADLGSGWTLRIHYSSNAGTGSGPLFGTGGSLDFFSRLHGSREIGKAIRWADSVINHLDPGRKP